jgi:two-component system sensor histidine kinase CiaH
MSIRMDQPRHRFRRGNPEPDHRVVTAVARRLALITTASLVVLVIAILAVVFVTTRSAMEQSLRDTLRTRAVADVKVLVDSERSGNDGNDGGDIGEAIQTTAESELTSGGVFLVVTNPKLAVQGGSLSFFKGKVPDLGAAKRVLADRSQTYSTIDYPPNDRYLIYTIPLQDGTKILGVAQLGVSLHQYDESVRTILRDVLIASAVGVAATMIITFIVVGRAMRPIRRSLRRQRDFVADAAHELRTPVAILRTATELGLGSDDAEEQQAALEQALAESVHLARLVDDLSLLAHADSGVLSLDRQRIDLASVVRDAVSGIEMLVSARDVSLSTETAQVAEVYGDWGRLRQLVLILLDNALKHTPEGGTISVRVAARGSRVDLEVQDSGPGIDPKDLPHLFDRFYRGSRERGISGGGLGLAIGRWVAEAHGGHISAANVSPHGARFTVTLPRT